MNIEKIKTTTINVLRLFFGSTFMVESVEKITEKQFIPGAVLLLLGFFLLPSFSL